MTRKSTLSAASVAVVNHLKANRRQTVSQLLAHFEGISRTVLNKRLRNLLALGWLDFATDEVGERIWFVRASARAVVARTAEPDAPRQPKEVLPVVEPQETPGRGLLGPRSRPG